MCVCAGPRNPWVQREWLPAQQCPQSPDWALRETGSKAANSKQVQRGDEAMRFQSRDKPSPSYASFVRGSLRWAPCLSFCQRPGLSPCVFSLSFGFVCYTAESNGKTPATLFVVHTENQCDYRIGCILIRFHCTYYLLLKAQNS